MNDIVEPALILMALTCESSDVWEEYINRLAKTSANCFKISIAAQLRIFKCEQNLNSNWKNILQHFHQDTFTFTNGISRYYINLHRPIIDEMPNNMLYIYIYPRYDNGNMHRQPYVFNCIKQRFLKMIDDVAHKIAYVFDGAKYNIEKYQQKQVYDKIIATFMQKFNETIAHDTSFDLDQIDILIKSLKIPHNHTGVYFKIFN
jgi:hypothetical protein